MAAQRKYRRAVDILLLIFFLMGVGILGYPTISNLWNQYRSRELVTAYQEEVCRMSGEKLQAMWQEAEAYNRNHTENVVTDNFSSAGDVPEEAYERLLNPEGNRMMGSLRIPDIDLRLPIYHGIGKGVLEKGCGHLYGTSLPVGGAGSHAVLAAHRGLPSAKLFTDLDQLTEGDFFFMDILDRTLAYKVDRIQVVLPTETDSLDIEEGKDYVTLVTCTPYGVNTHRLLIRGVRTPYEAEEGTEDAVEKTVEIETVPLLILGVLCFLGIFFLLRIILRPKSRR